MPRQRGLHHTTLGADSEAMSDSDGMEEVDFMDFADDGEDLQSDLGQ